MAYTTIMARGTSGDEFMHLKTSHIKSPNFLSRRRRFFLKGIYTVNIPSTFECGI
jgi:hypothetical protein